MTNNDWLKLACAKEGPMSKITMLPEGQGGLVGTDKRRIHIAPTGEAGAPRNHLVAEAIANILAAPVRPIELDWWVEGPNHVSGPTVQHFWENLVISKAFLTDALLGFGSEAELFRIEGYPTAIKMTSEHSHRIAIIAGIEL